MSKRLVIHHKDFGELDLKKFLFEIGHACIRSIRTSEYLEHKNVNATITHYIKEVGTKEERAAIRFLKEFVTFKTKTIMGKWRG
jgi:hypothetical protein